MRHDIVATACLRQDDGTLLILDGWGFSIVREDGPFLPAEMDVSILRGAEVTGNDNHAPEVP
jgi:hypothetical protein